MAGTMGKWFASGCCLILVAATFAMAPVHASSPLPPPSPSITPDDIFTASFYDYTPLEQLEILESYEAVFDSTTSDTTRMVFTAIRLDALNHSGSTRAASDLASAAIEQFSDVEGARRAQIFLFKKIVSMQLDVAEFTDVLAALDVLKRNLQQEYDPVLAADIDTQFGLFLLAIGENGQAAEHFARLVDNPYELTEEEYQRDLPTILGNAVWAFILDAQIAKSFECIERLEGVIDDYFEQNAGSSLEVLWRARVASYRARVYLMNDQYDEAIRIAQALLAHDDISHMRGIEASAHYVLGAAAFVVGNSESASAYFGDALGVAKEIGDRELALTMYTDYAASLEQLGEFEAAYAALGEYVQRRMELDEQQTEGRLALLQAEIARERRDSDIEELIAESEVAAQIVERDHRIKTLLGSGLLIVVMSFLLQAKSRKRLQQYAEELKDSEKKAQAAAQSKTTFLANMSHEIRTPLNGVLGMAQALAQKDLDDETAEYIDVISESGRTLLAVVNDVLDLSKIEAGQMPISPTPGDVRHSLVRLAKLWGSSAEEKGITLNLNVADDIPDSLAYDPVRIRQCVSNLISNAIKFTQRGAVDVTISAEPCVPDDEGAASTDMMISIAVSDTGIGMTDEQMGRLFNNFAQADDSTSRQFGGTGLGLVISRNLARMMGGDITVKSAVGQGSTFTLTFQAQKAAPRVSDSPETPSKIDETLRGLTVLLVDDNAVNRQVVNAFLKKTDVILIDAENGVEALEVLNAGAAIDIVLLDVHMPIMDGPETIKRIRASDKPWANVPVIALTADAMGEDRARYLKMGMNGYASKPIVADDLITEIVQCHQAGLATETSHIAKVG